jgi:2-polyprenyl-3-methyl-5-hydroxy-6-metoxy-1,4-benzoquinol methylase
MKQHELISKHALSLNRQLHDAPEGFGGSGWKHFDTVKQFADEIEARDVLDYGCGEGTLRRSFKRFGYTKTLREYDPAVRGKDRMPDPADLVVCTDVLEHVEPDKVDNVIAHLCALARKGCFLVIATRLANKELPDGRNAHLIVEGAQWWMERLTKHDWTVLGMVEKRKGSGEPHNVHVWLVKQ